MTPPVTCVLGMHRSGTSLVARLVNLLGVDLGASASLATPAPDNPGGYWEHADLKRLNDEILMTLGGRWDEPPPLPPGWEMQPRLAALRDVARRRLDAELADRASWGWKDPRNCLTLPFWRSLLPTARYILCVRNPLDVARSLERRDRFRSARSQYLWLRYVASALVHTTGEDRLLLSYEDLMGDRVAALERLARFMDGPGSGPPVDLRAVAAVIDEALHHNRTPARDVVGSAELAAPVRTLYTALRSMDVQAQGNGLDEVGHGALAAAETLRVTPWSS